MLKRTFLAVVLGSLTVSGFIGLAIFLVGDFGEVHARLLGTTACVGAFSITGLASASSMGRPNRRLGFLPYLGIASSIAALAVIVLLIWEVWGTSEGFKLVASLVVVAVSTAHLSILTGAKLAGGLLNGLRATTAIIVAAVASMLLVGIIEISELDEARNLYFRLLGILLILDVLGNVFVWMFSGRTSTPTRRRAVRR